MNQHRLLFSCLTAAIVLLTVAVLIAPEQAGAGDSALQYVQVSSHTAMTMNGQTIQNAAQAQKMMMGQAAKGMAAGLGASLLGGALTNVLSSVNPVLGLVGQLIANKIQQRIQQQMMQSMAPKFGVTQVQSEAVTTTVSPNRRRIDDGNITLLVQCDLKRLVTANNAAHTYSVKTFEELAAEGAAAQARGTQDTTGSAPAKSESCKSPRATVDHNADDQTDTIAGETAHHRVDTTTYTFPDDCDLKTKDVKMQQDTWYAPTDIPNQCQLPVAGNMPDQNVSSTVEIPLRIVRKIEMPMAMPTLPPDAMNNPQMAQVAPLLSHLSDFLTFTTETQTVKQVPLDPASFDVPAGYTQTEKFATPPPSIRQQM